LVKTLYIIDVAKANKIAIQKREKKSSLTTSY